MADDPANGEQPPHPEPPRDVEPAPELAPEPKRDVEPAPELDFDAGGDRDLERPLGSVTQRSWLDANRSTAVVLGCVGLCGLIAADVYVMAKSDAKRNALSTASATATATGNTESPTPAAPATAATAFAPPSASGTAPAEPADATGAAEDYQSDDGEPHSTKPTQPKHFATVQQAAVDSCTTASVDGLSRQIIAQARCLQPNAFVPLPNRPNLVIASQVFPYLELSARDQLLKAVDARPKAKMTINSALRTVAQQYLVWRWSASKRCGVPLATPPGESNHEIGVALDIAEAADWRPTLEAHEFKWLGASDRVHFDYKKGGPPPHGATDVLAFQKLWNRNHPTDKITEDGNYGPPTEQRLKQAPPDGFTLGPTCSKPSAPKH